MKIRITESVVSRLIPQSKPKEYRDASIRGFYMRVQPTGMKQYYFEYCNSDKSRQKHRLGKVGEISAADARLVALQLKLKLDQRSKSKSGFKYKKMTLREFISVHHSSYAISAMRNGADYRKRLETAFSGILDLHLDKINFEVVDRWCADYRKGREPASVNRALCNLQSALNKAVEWNMLEVNAMKGFKRLKTDKRKAVRYLSDEEKQRLMEALNKRERRIRTGRAAGNLWRIKRGYPLKPDLAVGYTDHLFPIVLTALHTGLRKNEIFTLRWKAVSFDKREITVEGFLAKSAQSRIVPMNQIVFDTLSKWRSQIASVSEDDFVFYSPRTKNKLNNIKKSWSLLLKTANIQNFRMHDLRHSFASHLAMRNISLQVIQQLLGHASFSTSLIYAHIGQSALADAVKVLE